MNVDTGAISCVVVGAGLSGLLAAYQLHLAGLENVVVEEAEGVGGRLATDRFESDSSGEGVVFDTGAQFFTVRDQRFGGLVREWQEDGLVLEWSRGFATADGSYYADGHPRYRCAEGMTAVPEHLAGYLDVRLNQRVAVVAADGKQWRVITEGGRSWTAGSVILTAPVPQSLDLLDAAEVSLPQQARLALERITYEPCVAVMVQLDGPGRLPEPGGLWPVGEPIAWIADNHRKGISPEAGAITIHAGPEFSQAQWEADDETVASILIDAANDWLGAHVEAFRVRRWRYSKPLWTHHEPCLVVTTPAPLIFAGDAFAGPRVEGAALSGIAAADWLLGRDR